LGRNHADTGASFEAKPDLRAGVESRFAACASVHERRPNGYMGGA
jgi:hypothetical protein